jgi:hypothetical protein
VRHDASTAKLRVAIQDPSWLVPLDHPRAAHAAAAWLASFSTRYARSSVGFRRRLAFGPSPLRSVGYRHVSILDGASTRPNCGKVRTETAVLKASLRRPPPARTWLLRLPGLLRRATERSPKSPAASIQRAARCRVDSRDRIRAHAQPGAPAEPFAYWTRGQGPHTARAFRLESRRPLLLTLAGARSGTNSLTES